MKLNKVKEQQFREAYGVMYETEEDIQKAMQRFDTEHHIIPNVSNSSSRRALVERLLTGNKRAEDPYRTNRSFHFEDIKYFLGDTPIDVVMYSVEFREPFQRKGFGIRNLVRTALENVGVEIRQVMAVAWSDTTEPLHHHSTFMNPEFGRERLKERTQE